MSAKRSLLLLFFAHAQDSSVCSPQENALQGIRMTGNRLVPFLEGLEGRIAAAPQALFDAAISRKERFPQEIS